jgi:pilus assembly protein Flp/PilA
MHATSRFVKDESGATAMEYGLAVALIAITIITAIAATSGNLGKALDNIAVGAFPTSAVTQRQEKPAP